MEHTQTPSTLFIFENPSSDLLTISLSTTGLEAAQDTAQDVMSDLAENIDLNMRGISTLYDIQQTNDGKTIEIRPFVDGDPFNQDVFNLVAEELSFMESLIRGDDEMSEDEIREDGVHENDSDTN